MSATPESVVLRWGGPATLADLRRAIKRRAVIRLALPLEVHHALFRHLNPDAAAGAPESCVIEGDAALLPRIATVAGLEALAELEPPTRAAAYRVEIATDDPLLTLLPPETR